MSNITKMNFEYRGPAHNVIKNGHELAALMDVLEKNKSNMVENVPEGFETFLIMRVNDELNIITAFDNDLSTAVVLNFMDNPPVDSVIGTVFDVVEPLVNCATYLDGVGFNSAVAGSIVSHIWANDSVAAKCVRELMPVVEIKEDFNVDFAGNDILIKETYRGKAYTLVIRDDVIYLDSKTRFVKANREDANVYLVSSVNYAKEELAGLPINLAEFLA